MTHRTSRLSLGIAIGLLLALPALAPASDAADDRIPIVDPELLESMGFEPGATNVYATPEAYEQMLMSPEERATASSLDAQDTDAVDAEGTVGDPAGFFSTIHASDFSHTSSNSVYSASFGGTELQCFEGSSRFIGVFRDLPSGANAVTPVVAYYDNDDIQNLRAELRRTCTSFFNFGGQEPETTTLWMGSSSSTPGYAVLVGDEPLNETIQGDHCVYTMWVRLGNGISCAPDNEVRLLKAGLGWHRQVSPLVVLGGGTFDDVPPDHLFSQHIEALADSGITAGCDADNFCPNASLTRGQMAVFLAKALGLDWSIPIGPPIAQ